MGIRKGGRNPATGLSVAPTSAPGTEDAAMDMAIRSFGNLQGCPFSSWIFLDGICFVAIPTMVTSAVDGCDQRWNYNIAILR